MFTSPRTFAGVANTRTNERLLPRVFSPRKRKTASLFPQGDAGFVFSPHQRTLMHQPRFAVIADRTRMNGRRRLAIHHRIL